MTTVMVTASGAPGTAALLRALRENAERWRTSSVVSFASGCTDLSSFMCTRAIVFFNRGSYCGTILSTTPTRKPPTRTSLPFTRFAPLGSCAHTSYVGTNGSPLFAL